jgi:hypothetical protein
MNGEGKQQVPAYIRRKNVEKALDEIVDDVGQLRVVIQQVLTQVESKMIQVRARL